MAAVVVLVALAYMRSKPQPPKPVPVVPRPVPVVVPKPPTRLPPGAWPDDPILDPGLETERLRRVRRGQRRTEEWAKAREREKARPRKAEEWAREIKERKSMAPDRVAHVWTVGECRGLLAKIGKANQKYAARLLATLKDSNSRLAQRLDSADSLVCSAMDYAAYADRNHQDQARRLAWRAVDLFESFQRDVKAPKVVAALAEVDERLKRHAERERQRRKR
jgi:hypothetical protein